MNELNGEKILALLRKREFIITVAIVVGIAVNVILFLVLLGPVLATRVTSELELFNLRAERESIEKIAIPEKIQPSEMTDYVNKVPAVPDLERFLITLDTEAKAAKVSITQIDSGETINQSEELDFTDIINGTAKIPTMAPNANQAAGDVMTADTPEEVKTAEGTSINKKSYTLQVSGLYPQVYQFIEKLQKETRIIAIDNIDLNTTYSTQQPASMDGIVTDSTSDTNGSTNTNSNNANALLLLNTIKSMVVDAKLTISIFYAESSKTALPVMPELSVDSPKNAEAPVVPDAQFFGQWFKSDTLDE